MRTYGSHPYALIASLILTTSALVACGDDETTSSSASDGGSGGTTNATTATGSGAGGASSSSATGGNAVDVPQGWSTATSLPSPRQETAVVALGGEVVVLGGFNELAEVVGLVEAYDPNTDSWRSLAPLPTALHHVHAAVVNEQMYVLGGLAGLNFTAVGACYRYDANTDTWQDVAPMPAGTERGGGMAGAIDGKIYVAGGLRAVNAVTDFSVYDTALDTWASLPPMPEALDHLAGGVLDGTTFVLAGGRDGSIEGIRDRVDAFDPNVGSWVSLAPMLNARGGTMSAVLDNRLYVIGGEGNQGLPSGVFSENASLSLGQNQWRAEVAMEQPVHGTGAATIGGVIYIPGGASTQAFGAVAVLQRYKP